MARDVFSGGDVFAGGSSGSGTSATLTAGLYLMSFFRTDSEKLYLAVSADGKTWTESSIPFYSAAVRVRDPSIMYRPADGYWYVAYSVTNDAGDSRTYFEIARSPDLHNWTLWATIDQAALTNSLAAPEWFVDVDGSIHLMFQAGKKAALNNNNFYISIWHITPTANDLSTWSAPVELVSGANQPSDTVQVVGGVNVYGGIMDAQFSRIGSGYVAFLKENYNDGGPYGGYQIQKFTAPALTGPWTRQTNGDWANWHDQQEAATLITLPGGGYRIFMDKYQLAPPSLFYSDSTDLTTWTAPQRIPFQSKARHCTVTQTSDLKSFRDVTGLLATIQQTNAQASIASRRKPWWATDSGLLGATFDPSFIAGATAVGSGVPVIGKVWLPDPVTISSVLVQVQVAGATLTAGQSFVGVYDGPTGTLLGKSADQSAAWVSTGLKTITVTPTTSNRPSAYTLDTPGGAGYFVHVAVTCVGTTLPQFARANITAFQTNTILNPTDVTQLRFGFASGTGFVDLPAARPAFVGGNTPWWFGVK